MRLSPVRLRGTTPVNPSRKKKQSASPPPEKMSERRYTEQEEALEIKSLRRTIAAYAKYVHHRPNPRSAPPLLPCWPVRIGPFIPAVDWKFISSGARSWKRFLVQVRVVD